MYKTYILGNGGYAQECFEQFVLGRVIKDFGGFLLLKNDKLVLINDEGINDFNYDIKASFMLGTGNVLNCFAMTNANANIGDFNLLNCYASVHHDVKMGSHNIFTTYATVLGYCTVGDDNWFANAVTVTSKTNIGNDNTLSSGEHLFEDMGDRQFFKHGIITEKPPKQ
jgi:UDP-3-O-[3-hydroxymyristoyl] glucosamine N-acyltransferase